MVYIRKYKHPREELLNEGKKIIMTDRDSKFLFRVAMVNLILSGLNAADLSDYCGIDERTLIGWVTKADTYGFESLRAVKQSGRPAKLTEKQKEEIKFAIMNDPQLEGYSNWDGPSLSDFIKKKYGIEFSVRASQKLFHSLNFSRIRPQTYPSKDEPNNDQRIQFKERINEVSGRPDTIIVFEDEESISLYRPQLQARGL